MGRIDDAIQTIESIADETERALQLAGLISTLFKIKGVSLVITGQLASDGYSGSTSAHPRLELASFAGRLAPRTILEIMRGQLFSPGVIHHWTTAGIPVQFHEEPVIAHRDLCRDFTTDHGVVKFVPVEEVTADYILAAVYPESNREAEAVAHQLLVNGLLEKFEMNWAVLHSLCHRPEYRVGEELARMRLAAKKDVDARGLARDHIGETTALPAIDALSSSPSESEGAQPSVQPPAEEAVIDLATLDLDTIKPSAPDS